MHSRHEISRKSLGLDECLEIVVSMFVRIVGDKIISPRWFSRHAKDAILFTAFDVQLFDFMFCNTDRHTMLLCRCEWVFIKGPHHSGMEMMEGHVTAFGSVEFFQVETIRVVFGQMTQIGSS